MRGSGHIEPRGTGIFRLRVDLGADPATGKRRQMSRTVRGSERKAKQELARLLTEIDAGRHDKGTTSRTVADLCRDWLEQARPNLSPNTAMEFDNSLRRYILPRLGEVPIAKLRAWDIDAAYRHLLAKGGKGGAPLAPATVKKAHTVLRLALAQAVAWKWIAENPALHAKAPKVPMRDPSPPEVEQCRALIERAEATDPDWATFIRLAAATGARRSELCALRWSNLDLGAGTVTISRAIIYTDDGVIDREYPKTASSRRRIAVDPETVTRLRAHKTRQAETALASGTRPVGNAYLFSVELDGSRPWHPHVVTHRFRRLRAAVGAKTVRLHDLRHYVATQLIANGVDARSVAGRLGHSNPNTTLRVYAAWVPAKDQGSADLLGALLDGKAQ